MTEQSSTPSAELEDEKTNEAVEDIVARESSELLALEDAKLARKAALSEQRQPGRVRRFFSAWLGTSKGRWITFVTLFLGSVAVGVVPNTRYAVLNAAGVRGGLSITIIDGSTLQPLKDVTISIQGVSGKTDKDGYVSLEDLRLGPAELRIKKLAFKHVSRDITIGWGSNPLDNYQLEPVGAQYTIRVLDFLSGKGIAKAEATTGESSALSDDEGEIILTIDQPSETFEVTLSANSYRSERFTINAETETEYVVRLVPARKHAFMSNRSGTLDLYTIDADGNNEELVLEGLGSEQPDSALLAHPFKDVAALVSRRGEDRGPDGRVLHALTVVDLVTKEPETVATSEQIQLVDWAGDYVVFTRVEPGTNLDDTNRFRLMSYNFKNKDLRELASASSFNDTIVINGTVYYAPASAGEEDINRSLFSISPDGSKSNVAFDKEVLGMVRTSYSGLALTTPDGWFAYNSSTSEAPAPSAAPSSLVSRIYVNSVDGTRHIWSDQRDGQGVLLVYDSQSGKDTIVHSQSGLASPFTWLNGSTIAYRIQTEEETADYAVSIHGGEPRKIQNVTNIGTRAR